MKRAARLSVIGLSFLPLVILAGPATAQAVRGQVVEGGGGQPLSGAFVVLVDDAGVRQQGVLADSAGRFLLRAPEPGRYRLVAELIGYAGAESPPLDLRVGPPLEYRLEVPVQAVDLTGIRVSTESRCEARPGSGPETAALWEEARKALEVQSWGEEQKALRMRIRQYARELSPNAHNVREASQRTRVGYYSSSPYVSRPAEELERLGYIREVDGAYDYYGPDAHVLLSETFLASHCFRVVDGPEEEPGLVGLAFEPVRDRDLPDVRGVLWVDRGTAELRRLDFTYTRLPFRGVSTDAAGGRVEFERLANGVWIVNRWRLRMPLVAEKRQPAWRSAMTELEVVALEETGAEVQSVADAAGTVLSEASGGTVYGVVWDSIHGEPLAEAKVTLGERTTTTGVDGAYRFSDVPSGSYPIAFTHPVLDLLGLELASRMTVVDGGTATRFPLGVPGPEAVAGTLCAADGQALVFGAVTDETARWPVPDALIRLESGGGAPGGRTVTADSAGAFRMCVPRGGSLALAAFRPGAAMGALTGAADTAMVVSVDTREALVRRVNVPVATGQARVTATWTNEIRGRVLTREGRDPVPGATVTLEDASGEAVATVVTDEAGAFQVPHPGQGEEFGLRAEHLGYAAAEGTVVFTAREELALELLLDPDPIEIEPIVVVERRRDFLADMGYYLRKERGLGHFIEQEDIARLPTPRLTDILGRTPGVRIMRGTGHAGSTTDIEMVGAARAGSFDRATILNPDATGGLRCSPAIYLDGSLIRPGGQPLRAYTPLDELVPPEAIEAIEVYRRVSEVPPIYSGEQAACGVVAVWTKRGT